jgi:hypothetical protein
VREKHLGHRQPLALESSFVGCPAAAAACNFDISLGRVR